MPFGFTNPGPNANTYAAARGLSCASGDSPKFRFRSRGSACTHAARVLRCRAIGKTLPIPPRAFSSSVLAVHLPPAEPFRTRLVNVPCRKLSVPSLSDKWPRNMRATICAPNNQSTFRKPKDDCSRQDRSSDRRRTPDGRWRRRNVPGVPPDHPAARSRW